MFIVWILFAFIFCCIVYCCVLLVLFNAPCYVLLLFINIPFLCFVGACWYSFVGLYWWLSSLPCHILLMLLTPLSCIVLVLIDAPCYVILVLIGTPLLHFIGACQCILVLLCSLEKIFKYMTKFVIRILVIKNKND